VKQGRDGAVGDGREGREGGGGGGGYESWSNKGEAVREGVKRTMSAFFTTAFLSATAGVARDVGNVRIKKKFLIALFNNITLKEIYTH